MPTMHIPKGKKYTKLLKYSVPILHRSTFASSNFIYPNSLHFRKYK